MKRSLKSTFIVGFALFSMLFGAGNVIFPPYLGLSCGKNWIQGFLYYYMADIGLALTCLFAIQKNGGQRKITRHLGKIPAELLTCVIVLCIGPMLGIPRTAASTFELSVMPLVSGINPCIFSAVFFLLTALLCMKENAVVDIIGKILTPVLIIGLLILIVKGAVHPIGPADGEVLVQNIPVTGISAGYQTMDVLAVTIFGILISKNVREKGYGDLHQQNKIIFGAGFIAGIGLLIIYLGLTYLGATAANRFNLSVDRTFLITSIVKLLLGKAGTLIFALVVAFACMTTAVALVGACSEYFSNLTGGKVKYQWVVLLICGCSAIVTPFGLNEIIRIAGPILDVVYPPTLFILVASYFNRWIKSDWFYRMGALGASAFSLMAVLTAWGLPFTFLRSLPLYSYGFGWVVPAVICGLIGNFIPCRSAAEDTTTILR